MGKKKIKVEDGVDGKVNLSPMIDCCFLLLIFFVVNATALTVSKDPSVAMPQTVDPTDLENAEGCIVVNVFDPPSLNAQAANGDDKTKKAAASRIEKLKTVRTVKKRRVVAVNLRIRKAFAERVMQEILLHILVDLLAADNVGHQLTKYADMPLHTDFRRAIEALFLPCGLVWGTVPLVLTH